MYKFFFLFIILFSSCGNKKDDSFYKQDKNQIYKTTSNLIGYNQNNKIDYLSLFLSSNYISVDSLYKTINYLISINDLSAAIKYAEDIIKLEPKKSKSYLNLANICTHIFIEEIPNFDEHNSNQQLRFITLIDILYEKKINLTLSMEKDLNNIGTSKKHSETFKRTTSRLQEMTASKLS